MKVSSRGGSLRAVSVQPDPSPGSQQTDSPPSLSPTSADGTAINSGLDDLQNLPDSPTAMPVQPTDGDKRDTHATIDHEDLNDLPDASGQLGHVYDAVYHGDPDNVAQVLDTSKKLGADPEMVAGSLKDASKAANGPDQNFFQAIEQKFPGTTKFLQTPQNMAVAHDDLPNVAQHEDLIEKVKSAFASEGNALKGGALQEELAMLRYQQLHGEQGIKTDSFRLGGMVANELGAPNDTIENRVAWIQGQLDEINKSKPGPDSGWIKRGIYGATEFLPQIASGAMTGLKFAAPAAGTAAAAGLFLGPADVLPASAAAGVGFGVGEADYNYRLMSGMAYDSLSKVRDTNGQPLPDNVVRIGSMATGAAAAALGMVKLGAVLESIPGGKEFFEKFTTSVPAEVLQNSATRGQALKNFANNYVTSVAHGTAAMTGITAVNILGERGAEAASGQEFDHSKEPGIASQLFETAKDAAATFGVMGGIGPVAVGAHEMQAARRAQTNREFYLAMGETAEASKLRQRLPEAHKELLDGLTKDGPVEHLYVPQEAFQSYFQGKNIDPEVVANELGIQDSYKEALQTGGDIKIPTATWASKVAGTEHYQGLANDIKFDPQDLTSNEVEQRRSEIADQMKKTEEQAKEGVEPQLTSSESAARIYDERYAQLLDAGVSPAEAKQAASLHEAAFRTLGERTGQDPHELAKRFQLEIQRRESMDDEKTQVVQGEKSKFGEAPEETPSYATGEQQFLEQTAAINSEVETLKAGEETPESKARISELEGQRKELLQAQQGRTDKGGAFYQGDDKGPRGKITFQNSKATIELFKNADRSTFLHESGHYFLEIMNSLAQDENGPESIKKDMQAIREWVGLKEGEEFKTEQHEKFARGFEAYLREGEAPSPALAKAFAKFKQWLVQIYRSAKNLRVELSPQIREVMDRMLATDDEIRQAQAGIGFHQDAGKEVPANIKDRMNSLAEQAREKAESTLMREQMKELSETNKQFIAGERTRLRAEGEAKAAAEPVFKAQNDIQEAIGNRRKVLALAGKMLDHTIKSEDAAHFEVAAEVNGFVDGESLANEILASAANGAKEKIVEAHVEAGMRPHANLMDKASIKEQAMRAVHNEHMTELLALEKQIFDSKMNEATMGAEVSRRQRVEARIAAAEAKEQAKQILNDKPIREAGNFRIYTTAERNAAVRADAAVKRKDFARAAEYKRQQMLNHALAAEAMRNRDEVEKAEKFLNKAADRKGDLKDMPFAFNKQVDMLLERFGVKEKSPGDQDTMLQIATDMQGKGETMDDIANATGMVMDKRTGQFRPEEIRDFITRVNENYVGLQLPESILSGEGASDYRDLQMGDLRDLQSAVKTITQLGKKYDRFLNEFIQIDMKQAASRFKGSVKENIGEPYGDVRKLGDKYSSPLKKMVENIKNIPDAMISTMVNTLTLCTYLDGGEANGPAHDYIYRPMKQAEDRKFARYAKMREELTGENGLFSKFYNPKELADYKKKVTEYDGRSLTKEQILSMAMNWGNEQNRDRIRAGFGSRDASGRLVPLSDEAINGLFKNLGKKDWDFAQAIWNHLETYWPEIAALEMKIRGVEPERVVHAPFENEHGSFAGGYYPIAYDFEKSNEAFKNEQQKTELYKSYSAASAQTEQGHSISRVSFVARPVRLSMDVFFNHLENVIHDLEFRPAIIDVNKFMNMPDVKGSIQNAVGMDAFRGMESWLKGIASDQSENLTWLDKAMTWTRFGTTISALGMTPKAFLLHMPSNVFNAMWETGVQNTVRFMTKAALDVAMGRGELKSFVFERSERMKQRLTVRDRDIMDMAKAWQGTQAGVIPHYAFMSLHLADESVSVPLWADTYQKNVAEFGEKKAGEIADETVTRTLGSGSKVDQIGFQRGSQTKKLFTMFYSWMSVMFNRAWLDGKMSGLEYKQGNVGQAAAILAKATFYAWALPAVHEALLSQAMSNKPGASSLIPSSDDEKKQFVGKIIEHPFAMIPFVRDIAQPIIHKTLGEHGGDYKMSPVESAIQNIYNPLADGARIAFTDGKHFDEKYAEEVARGMSQVAGYPQQLNTWAFNLMDYIQHNGEASMKDFLSRRRKK